MIEERAKVRDLVGRGRGARRGRRPARVVRGDRPRSEAGGTVRRSSGPRWSSTALRRATPTRRSTTRRPAVRVGFLAQGSEFGFGKMYARGINDEALDPGRRSLHPRGLVQHPQHLGAHQDAGDGRRRHLPPRERPLPVPAAVQRHQPGRIVHPQSHGRAPRRPALRDPPRPRRPPPVRDPGLRPPGLLVGGQAQHAVHARPALQPAARSRRSPSTEAIDRLAANPRVALTHKRSANQIFSFGRDHGYYGRILSQTVVPIETLAVRDGTELVGLLLHPAGRQRAAVLDRGHPVVPPRRGRRSSRGATPVPVPGGLRASPPRGA